MKTFDSRFGIVSAGKITAFSPGRSITVDGEKIKPTESFWNRFNPQRVTVVPAPKAKDPRKQKPDGMKMKTDFTIGYYVLQEGGHDRFVTAEEFETFTPQTAGASANA